VEKIVFSVEWKTEGVMDRDTVIFKCQKTVFAFRVVNVWNSLPPESTNFSSLTSFRLSLLIINFSKFVTIN